MTRKSKARYGLKRTYKISPTVKALRSALFLGFAAAAAAPSAQAGTCLSIVNDVQCFGDFGDDTLDSWNELAVSDAYDPATVDMNGTLYTDNSDGIIAWNFDDIAFTNDGTVLVNDSWYSEWSYNRVGVYAESFQGDVAFDNTGVIGAIENSGNLGTSFTLGARIEAAQDITAINSGFIGSENDGGFAGGLQATSYGGGTITITNTATGDFGAEANNFGDAVALGVYNASVVNISNDGDIAAASDDDSAYGIRVTEGDTTITAGSTSEINVLGDTRAVGISVSNYYADAVDITNAGLIETDATANAYGIRVVQDASGDVAVSNSGTIDSYAYNGSAAGIDVNANDGDVTVTNSQNGTILADGYDSSTGITVSSVTGDITISNSGAIYSGSVDPAGISTFGKYAITVDISNSGTIGVVADNSIYSTSAVGVYSLGFNNDTTVTNSGDIYAVGGNDANYGVVIVGPGTGSYGTATVTNTGVILAGLYDENIGIGNQGNSFGDAYGVYVNVNGDVIITNTGSYSEGGYASIIAYSEDSRAVGVQASSSNGNVSVTNSNKYSVIAAASGNNNYANGYTTTFGIYAEALDGSVNVNNGGFVISSNNNYGDAIGIRAEAYEDDMMAPLVAYAADGDITVTNSGLVSAVSKYDNAVGVQAFSNYGDITISNAGAGAGLKYAPEGIIYAIAEDGNATGIQAQTGAQVGGDGNITISNTGAYVIAEGFYGATGISADTYSGTITVTNTGSVVADSYGSSFGINANTDSGAITISNNTDANGNGGMVVALTDGDAYAYGINASINDYNSTSNISITNGYGALIYAQASYAGEYTDAFGIRTYNAGSGDILITNSGTISADSYDDAYAIWAYADGNGDISITNTATGSLLAVSQEDDVYGIYAYADGDGNVIVTNAGDIGAYAYGDNGDAYGVYAYANGDGNVTVTNSGSITATVNGDYGEAYGIYAGVENEGDVTVTNSGSILVGSTGFASDAMGIYAYSDDGSDITINNDQYGTIAVSTSGAYSFAVGIEVENDDSDNDYSSVTITNDGSVTVGTTGYDSNANGIWTHGGGDHDADVTITNNGSFSVTTTGYGSDAWGIEVDDIRGDKLVSVANNGDITVAASYGTAYGIQTATYGFETDTTITNNGDLIVSTGGNSLAIGIDVYAENAGYGDIRVTNTANGTIDASSSYGPATGIGVFVGMDTNLNDGGDVVITNAGDVLVQAAGPAYGIAVDVDRGVNYYYQYSYTCYNYAGCTGLNGSVSYLGTVITQYAFTEFGDGGMPVTVNNSGLIDVVSEYANAEGITINMGNGSYGELASITNSGTINVLTEDGFVAWGIHVDNQFGDISVSNTATGTIDAANESAYAYYGEGGYAVGIRTYAEFGDTTISNAGDIIVGDSPWRSNGIRAENKYGDVTVSNLAGGSISVNTGGFDAYGIEVDNKYGDVTVSNAGAITVGGGAWNNKGIEVDNEYGDTVITTAIGSSISVTGEGSEVTGGILAYSETGDITITNAGTLTVTADNFAIGINAYSDYGDITVSNSATFTVTSADSSAVGISAETDLENGYFYGSYSDSHVTVTNSGNMTVSGYYTSEGIQARTEDYGDISITNAAAGGITVTSAEGRAYGINVYADGAGDVTIGNAGIITATANGDFDDAFGINAETDNDQSYASGGNITITTAAGSSITAIANGDYGDAYGMYLRIEEDADMVITNGGSITATANGYNSDAYGIYAEVQGFGDITLANTAAITVSATGGYSDAKGIEAYAHNGSVTVSNSAAITVTADDYAVGIYAYSDDDGDASVTNAAAGHVRATGDSATGISVQSDSYGYDATLTNAGKITVVSRDGDAYGAYVETDGGGTLSITSSGDITVSASGIDDYAVGLYAQHEDYGDIIIASSSTITVNSTGAGGDAVGIKARSYDGSDISITNSGTILANATNGGFSIGIYTENFGGSETTITNSGSVKATGVDAYAIYHYGTDVDIVNTTTGKIFGVIYTDYGNDTFTNNGKWYATEGVNYFSYFAEGDDAIVNSATGKIYMEDSYIHLGSADTVNSFLNNGKIYVDGNNYIDMGTATSVFTNNGASLHFEDGAANDVLTIFGDFAGSGHIVVDANGTSMLADRLYIEGDVVSSTANVIDVYLNQNPSLQDMVDGELIDIVHVSGTSAAANFNLGIVDVEDDSLYTVDYELVKQINYSGTNDLFSLGFEITGLTASGVAVSSIAPAVQNLWHLGVGTVFQREGTMRDSSGGGSANSLMNAGFKDAAGGSTQVAEYQGAAGLWLRAFSEDGTLNPDGSRDNFGLGGEHNFDLKSSGIEFGVGYALNGEWTAGLLGGVSDGTVKPTIGGRTNIDAKTFGGYVTYTPGNGFYADLSYRSMDFDGDGNGGGQDFNFEGQANGFSLEMGYGVKTSSGLVIEPQFQYSSMDVDLDNVDYSFDGFELADGKSSQTRLGVSLRKTMDSGNGNSWTPYVSVSYVNESNASNDYVIGGVLTGNVDTSGGSTLFEGGATIKYGNMVFSGGLNWKDGGAYESMFGGQVSVRFTW